MRKIRHELRQRHFALTTVLLVYQQHRHQEGTRKIHTITKCQKEVPLNNVMGECGIDCAKTAEPIQLPFGKVSGV